MTLTFDVVSELGNISQTRGIDERTKRRVLLLQEKIQLSKASAKSSVASDKQNPTKRRQTTNPTAQTKNKKCDPQTTEQPEKKRSCRRRPKNTKDCGSSCASSVSSNTEGSRCRRRRRRPRRRPRHRRDRRNNSQRLNDGQSACVEATLNEPTTPVANKTLHLLVQQMVSTTNHFMLTALHQPSPYLRTQPLIPDSRESRSTLTEENVRRMRHLCTTSDNECKKDLTSKCLNTALDAVATKKNTAVPDQTIDDNNDQDSFVTNVEDDRDSDMDDAATKKLIEKQRAKDAALISAVRSTSANKLCSPDESVSSTSNGKNDNASNTNTPPPEHQRNWNGCECWWWDKRFLQVRSAIQTRVLHTSPELLFWITQHNNPQFIDRIRFNRLFALLKKFSHLTCLKKATWLHDRIKTSS